MHQSVMQRYKLKASFSFLKLFRSSWMLLLIPGALAGESALVGPSNPSVGLVEITNLSPAYLLSIASFEDDEECRGMKYVVELEKFKLKTIEVPHRETLSLWITFSAASARGLTTCGAIYSLPYIQGDLRVLTEWRASQKQCLVSVSSSQDGRNWVPVPGFRKRVGRTHILTQDPRCERE